MAIVAAEAAPEIASVIEGGSEAAGGGGLFSRLGGMVRDFNDSPVGKVLGTIGKGDMVVHGLQDITGHGGGGGGGGGPVEAGPPTGGVNIGPMANV